MTQVLKCRAVQQHNPVTEETALTLTTDPLTPIEDYKIGGGSWGEGDLKEGEVIIIGPPDLIKGIAEKEFKSVL
jgi:hypothetical protein